MTDSELLARADAVADRAYAPYSDFRVGCAVLTRTGAVIEGVNVENASRSASARSEPHSLALSRRVTDRATSLPRRSRRRRAGVVASGCSR